MHIELTDNARRVLEKRILARDLQGRLIETPEEMFHRVAHNIAAADSKHGTPTGSAPIAREFRAGKRGGGELKTLNVCVAVSGELMERVKTGEKYDLINPRTHEGVRQLDAREVLDRIVKAAWRNGEPGVIFIDRINRDNPTP